MTYMHARYAKEGRAFEALSQHENELSQPFLPTSLQLVHHLPCVKLHERKVDLNDDPIWLMNIIRSMDWISIRFC